MKKKTRRLLVESLVTSLVVLFVFLAFAVNWDAFVSGYDLEFSKYKLTVTHKQTPAEKLSVWLKDRIKYMNEAESHMGRKRWCLKVCPLITELQLTGIHLDSYMGKPELHWIPDCRDLQCKEGER